MAAPTLMSLPAEIRTLIWQYAIPAVVVEVIEFGPSESDGHHAPGPAEMTVLPPNPALPVMLVCHQARIELLSIPICLIAEVYDPKYKWWLRVTTQRYKRHFNAVRIIFGRKVVSAALLESRRSDSDIRSDFEQFWEHVEILFSSAWILTDTPETSSSSWYTVEATVELKVSGAIEAEIESDEEYWDWET